MTTSCIYHGDDGYPERLYRLGDDAPRQVFFWGDLSALDEAPLVALVGSRAATLYGVSVTADLAVGLGRKGYGIVSGGAYGIDAAAHRAAIRYGFRTVVVLPCGINRAYPAAHADLLATVASLPGCAVVSGFPIDHEPTRSTFLGRNRIIAALSVGVVAVEAGRRSGSLNTVNHASRIGVPVMAMPGPITSAMSAGTNDLIREGKATLVTDAHEVIETIEKGVDTLT